MINVKLVKNDIVYDGEELHLYIPEEYYERSVAIEMGEYVSVLGVLNAQEYKKGKPVGKLELFSVPAMVDIYPTEMESTPEIAIIPGVKKQKYTLAKFYKGDKIMSADIAKDSSNAELFLRLLMSGALPPTIRYEQLLRIWDKNLDISGIRLNVSSNIMEIIIREIYRDPKDPTRPFAMRIGASKDVSQLDYQAENIREICALNSTFSGIIFEYFDRMVGSGIMKNVNNTPQTISPVEKIIKM